MPAGGIRECTSRTGGGSGRRRRASVGTETAIQTEDQPPKVNQALPQADSALAPAPRGPDCDLVTRAEAIGCLLVNSVGDLAIDDPLILVITDGDPTNKAR